MRIKLSALLIGLVWLTIGELEAQLRWEANIFLGGANYQGDLVETNAPVISETNLAMGFSGRILLNNSLKLRGDLLYGQLTGNDKNAEQLDRIAREFSFTSKLMETGLALEWTPFLVKEDDRGRRKYRKVAPYIFSGISLYNVDVDNTFSMNPEGAFDREVEKDKGVNYPNSGWAIPFGGGIQFNLKNGLYVVTEVGTRLANDDYVDGFSYAANPNQNDWYWFGGVGVGLRFEPKDNDADGIVNRKDNCPDRKGSIENGGCPDQDGDGVVDQFDHCPSKYGLASLNGCPDRDSDGIADREDRCPRTPGIALAQGCPDADTDAIPDKKDKCPHLAGSLAGQGCPILDANANGTVEDEKAALKQPHILNALNKHQKNYWWLRNPGVWSTLSW